MNRKMTSLAFLATVVCAFVGAALVGPVESATTCELQKTAETPEQPPATTHFEPTLANQPGKILYESRNAFITGDVKRSSLLIHEAADLLRDEASRATTGEGEALLTFSANDLTSMAERVSLERVRSADEMDEPFARAHYALSRHNYLSAIRQRKSEETAAMTMSLRNSAMHLQDSWAWSRQPAQQSTVEVIKSTNKVTQNLDKGMSPSHDEVGRLIAHLGMEIQKLAVVVEPIKPGPKSYGR